MSTNPFILYLVLASFLFAIGLHSQSANEFIFGDALPDAPALAERGDYKVGVKTLDFVNKDQIDVLNSKEGIDPLYDRNLKVEVWYPADLNGDEEMIMYPQVMGVSNNPKRPLIPFEFKGRAARDAEMIVTKKKFPLIVVSHGYVGSRYLMTYLTENLASKGYVVVAIDHQGSTFKDAKGFQSTLLNRAKDILFIVDELAATNAEADHFLFGRMDVENIGVIGYSMGGYGALNVAGAGYSEGLAKFYKGMTGGSTSISALLAGSAEHDAMFDERIKAVVAFAPWGMTNGIWDSIGLEGLKIPTFFIAGSEDDISGYENGIKAIYEGATNVERYLLTYSNARHNIAPNPPAPETMAPGLDFDEYYRYAEPSWDERRINNINQHFITAFMGSKLKAEDHSKYLELPTNSNDKTWEGFKERSSTGLELLHAEKE